MGCGLSTRLNPEDAATLSHGHISDTNSSANGFLKSASASQGKDAKHVGEGGDSEEEEKEEVGDHDRVLIFPRSPSFRVYCIASPNFRNQSFSDNDSSSSINNNDGDDDSANNDESEDKKEGKKRESRRMVGVRNVIQKAMGRRRRRKIIIKLYNRLNSFPFPRGAAHCCSLSCLSSVINSKSKSIHVIPHGTHKHTP